MLIPKEIEIGDKLLFCELMGKRESSTFNFTTLYMWAGDGKIKYAVSDGCLVLFFNGRRGAACTYPVGNGNRQAAAEKAFDFMKCQGQTPRFILMSEDMVKECEAVFPNQFGFYSDRNNADYIYSTESLITLRGKKLHTKKNHLNAFLNTYDFQYQRLGAGDMDECMDLFYRWKEGQKNTGSGFSEDATLRLLQNQDKLGVTIGGIFVDGKLAAFSAGEAATDDMALIHIEYADTRIRGAFNIMNQQFCQQEWSSFSYINREEDMGIEGLRKAKMAYRPVKMIEKYYTEYGKDLGSIAPNAQDTV